MTARAKICGRQIGFFAAFVLPVYKLMEAPSILARYAKGDLLLPALLHFLVQAGVLVALVYAVSRDETTLSQRLQARLGKGVRIVYAAFALYYLFTAILPLLDLEKFVYAVFYDTAPTIFSFAFFFLFSAFVCSKALPTSTGRSADISLFFFLIPFLALILMSLTEADFTGLLPLFERQFGHTVSAFTRTLPHFSDAVLLLPLLARLEYKKGDSKKILFGYGAGCVFTLVFLAAFYALFSTIAPREHYAFAKIAQYFPALTVVGRIDLIFVYMLCVVLFFFVATPMQYAVDLSTRLLGERARIPLAATLNFAAFLFVLLANKHYDGVYALIGGKLFPVFLLFGALFPLCLLFFAKKEKKDA